jgi:hypothetical protein
VWFVAASFPHLLHEWQQGKRSSDPHHRLTEKHCFSIIICIKIHFWVQILSTDLFVGELVNFSAYFGFWEKHDKLFWGPHNALVIHSDDKEPSITSPALITEWFC